MCACVNKDTVLKCFFLIFIPVKIDKDRQLVILDEEHEASCCNYFEQDSNTH